VIKSVGQFFLSSVGRQKGIDQLRWVSVQNGGTRPCQGLTFEPSTNVLERDLVRNIVQQQCGVCAAIIHRCLYLSKDENVCRALIERKLRLTERLGTDHTSKTLLSSSVPKLEAHLDTIYGHFLCDEEGSSCRCCVLWIELVLSVSLKEAGLAYALSRGKGR
jgi:hypothetical protein